MYKLADGTPLNIAVYRAYRHAGLSHSQALGITAEVGRENGFNENVLFGSHIDPARNKKGGSIRNIGMLSWNGNRGTGLAVHLKKRGVFSNGVMARNQANLNAQAEYSVREMKTKYRKKLKHFWRNPNANPDSYAKELGRNYIVWAYGQNSIRSKGGRKRFDWKAHDNRRRNYLQTLNSSLGGGTIQPMRASHKRNNNWLVYQNQGKIRNKPLSKKLINSLGFLGDMGITMKVASGGQSATGKRRTGSHRHDYGNAGDVDFYKNGRKLSFNNSNDRAILQEIVQRAKANGVTGFGAGHSYMGDGRMHIGFGKPAVWGAGGKGVNAPKWLVQAFNSKQRLQPLGNPQPQAPMGRFRIDDLLAQAPKQPMGQFKVDDLLKQEQAQPQSPMGKFKIDDLLAEQQAQQTQPQSPTPQSIQTQTQAQVPQPTSEFNTFGAISNELPKLKEQGLNPYQALYSLAQRDDEIGQSIKTAYQKGMNSEQLTDFFGVNKIWQTQSNLSDYTSSNKNAKVEKAQQSLQGLPT